MVRQRHKLSVEDLPPPNVKGYDKLAPLWDEYAGWFVPRYGRFLPAAGDYYGRPIRAVLDLACGTGLLTRRFARRAESVVGLDASQAMLREARLRTTARNVRYVQGDFRDFSLECCFDAAICGSDSLNYVEEPAELAAVFACVSRHLRPGGLFIFDVLDGRAFRDLASIKVVAYAGGERFEIYYFYDPATRVSESRAVFRGLAEEGRGSTALKRIVERHRRVPIEEGEVRRAAGEAGMEVTEHYSRRPWLYLLLRMAAARQFYVLQRPV
jgi:SAM-dependent methyltransferase